MTREELVRLRDAALRDERIDGRRAEEAYAAHNGRRGQFFGQEARRDGLLADVYQRRIDALDAEAAT